MSTFIERQYSWFRSLFFRPREKGEMSGGYLPAIVREKALGIVKNSRSKKSILDLGCGEGLFLDAILRSTDLHVTGIDISDELLKRARKRIGYTRRCELLIYNGKKLPFESSSFRLVAILNLVMSLPNKEAIVHMFSEAARVLEPGGVLITDFRNAWNLPNLMRYKLVRFLDSTIDSPLHCHCLGEITEALSEAGLAFDRRHGLPKFVNAIVAPTVLIESHKNK